MGIRVPVDESYPFRAAEGPGSSLETAGRDHATSHHASHPRIEPTYDETVELLRTEVAQLQQELADRDARLAELDMLVSSGGDGGDSSHAPSPDTLALVTRLEHLLDELQQKDAHAASLEELLHASEEARRADAEERSQIESWLSEIERRVAQRESEWHAADEAWRHRVAELSAARDRAEAALEASSRAAGAEPAEGVIRGLREQMEKLQNQLCAKTAECSQLEERAAQAPAASAADARKAAVDDLLREERLALARERAELARHRAEQEQVSGGPQRSLSEVDQRVQVLREHLREIHERQMQDEKSRRPEGFSARLSALWKRLEDWAN